MKLTSEGKSPADGKQRALWHLEGRDCGWKHVSLPAPARRGTSVQQRLNTLQIRALKDAQLAGRRAPLRGRLYDVVGEVPPASRL